MGNSASDGIPLSYVYDNFSGLAEEFKLGVGAKKFTAMRVCFPQVAVALAGSVVDVRRGISEQTPSPDRVCCVFPATRRDAVPHV